MLHGKLSMGVSPFPAEQGLAFLQDACCEVPSDWLDQGQSDMNVPEVPEGFMREVVLHEQAFSQAPATHSSMKHPTRSVYYHYFQVFHASEGPSVRRMALLRAAANPCDPHAMDTVEGFLRSDLCDQMDALQQSDFDFSGGDTGAPRSVLAASLAHTPSHTTTPATLQRPSSEVVASACAVGGTSGAASLQAAAPAVQRSTNLPAESKPLVRNAAFPIVGGALRCCGCGRWHNVPEHVMHAVRCPSPRSDAVWWMACACCVTSNHFF
jgi:hypothetical protein